MFIEAWKRLKDLNLWVPPSSSYKSIYKSPEIYTHGPGVNLHFWRKCLICGWVFYSPGDCCEWWVVMVHGAPELDRLFQGFLHIYCFLDPGRRSFFGGGLELALAFRESERTAVRCRWTSRRVRANLILNIWRVNQVCWSVVLINAENLDNHQNCLPLFTVVHSHYCGTAAWNELHLKLNQSSVEQLVVLMGCRPAGKLMFGWNCKERSFTGVIHSHPHQRHDGNDSNDSQQLPRNSASSSRRLFACNWTSAWRGRMCQRPPRFSPRM